MCASGAWGLAEHTPGGALTIVPVEPSATSEGPSQSSLQLRVVKRTSRGVDRRDYRRLTGTNKVACRQIKITSLGCRTLNLSVSHFPFKRSNT